VRDQRLMTPKRLRSQKRARSTGSLPSFLPNAHPAFPSRPIMSDDQPALTCTFPLPRLSLLPPSSLSFFFADFNVLLAFSFIIFDSVLSLVFGLGIGTSLVVAAVRCVVQLSVMSLILDR